VDLACDDRADAQVRLDENTGWNTTARGFGCDDNSAPLDEDWYGRKILRPDDVDDFRTQDGDANWVETSRYPDDLEMRFRLAVSQGGNSGFFLDGVAFAGSSD
jgi:hypothetical protein